MLFLLQRQADYVWVGPRERQLGGLPAGLNLSPAYSQDGIDVYYARKAP
jgi:hypothetical protein